MAMYDGADPSEWNEGMFLPKGCVSFDVAFILDVVVRRVVLVNLLMQVTVMALRGVA